MTIDYLHQSRPGDGVVPPRRTGKPLKFVVVDPTSGNRSSTWVVKAGRGHDDVYFFEQVTGQDWKTSLHNDWGWWRVGRTSESARELVVERFMFDEWARPRPTDGWSRSISLLVPCAYLQRWPDDVPEGVVQVPVSPAHSAVVVEVLLAEPGSPMVQVDEGFLVGAIERANEGLAWIYAWPMALREDQHAALADQIKVVKSQPECPSVGRFIGVLRIDDSRVMVDMRLD